MGGKRRICNRLLTALCGVLILGCSVHEQTDCDEAGLAIRLSCGIPVSRTAMPDEERLGGIRIFVFDEYGSLEAELTGRETSINLRAGASYSILACANIEQEMKTGNLEDIMNSRYAMHSPYDYEKGMPMCGSVSDLYIDKDTTVEIMLERLMAKISLRMDRSRLNEGTMMQVNRVRVGNCPAGASVFQESRVTERSECFDIGFESDDTAPLNSYGSDGLSGELSLYLLENMQGCFSSAGPASEAEKVFDEDDERRHLCSYIEMEMEYHSDSLFCTGKPLIYRFYIGDGLNSLDVERNCHYHITVCPDGDGLPEDKWRVEKEDLHSYVQRIQLSEDHIVLDYRGKVLGLDAVVFPAHAYCRTLSWESSDPGVASVDSEGRVCAAGEGECLIRCSATDGSGVMASCLVRSEFAPPHFAAYPEDKYINGDIGDTVRLWCDVFPPNTPFDVGLEYLEDDKAAGIYDYIVDDDGHGVTLILKRPGSGLIYMEALEPVNEAALYFIEVNLPDDG